MSKKIDDIIEKFKPSEPIFTLKVDSDGTEVRCSHPHKGNAIHEHYRGEIENTDALTNLVLESFREDFKKDNDGKTGEFVVAKNDIRKRVIKTIEQATLKYLEEIMPQKNPKETKMFKWYRKTLEEATYPSKFMEAIVDVYNYRKTQYDKGFISKEEENKMDSNLLGIYNLLYHRNS